MISTRPFKVSSKEHFSMQLAIYLKLKWYFVIALALSVIMMFLKSKEAIYILLFLVAIVLLVLFNLWYLSYGKRNASWLKHERVHQFHEDRFTTTLDDAFSEISYKKLQKIEIKETFAALYLSSRAYVYVPYTAFATEADVSEFKKLMHHINVHILGNYKKQEDTVIDQ